MWKIQSVFIDPVYLGYGKNRGFDKNHKGDHQKTVSSKEKDKISLGVTCKKYFLA